MKKKLLIVLVFLNIVSTSNSQTIINAGDVYGRWEKNKSPFYINGNILIPNQKSLIIEAGVKVFFNGHYSLTIKGALQANGSKQDSILFTVSDTSQRWKGIRLEDVEQSNDTTRLFYCIIERSYASSGLLPNAYGPGDIGGGIYSSYSRLSIANSVIRNNRAFHIGGIYSNMNAKIINTKIINNHAVEVGGLCVGQNSKVIGCLISCNSAEKYGGLTVGAEKILFANNTVCFNRSSKEDNCAVFFEGQAEIVNNIFYYNTPKFISVGDGYGSPSFLYNDVENGLDGIIDYKPTLEGFFDGIFENNIELPPVFVDPIKHDFRLKESPCINSGDSSFHDTDLQFDLDGNPRVFADSQSRIDIGAYEYIGILPNRRPFIRKTDEKYFIKNTNNIVSRKYFDVDKDDNHFITVYTNEDNVDINYFIDKTDQSIVITIKPKLNWTGVFYLYTNIQDNSNSINSNFIDSVKVRISRKFKGKIENNIVFKDTVEVIDDVVVMGDGTLTIMQGTYVEFQDQYVLNVIGQLKVLGTADHRVVLNAKDSSVYSTSRNNGSKVEKGWGGIIIQKKNQNDTILVNYCTIKNTGLPTIEMNSYRYSFGTLTIKNSDNISINNCIFDSNSPVAQNSGITIYNSNSILVTKCLFSRGNSSNLVGSYIHAENSKTSIDSCVFEKCFTDGVIIESHNILIKNSVFYDNSCSKVIVSSNCDLENNLFYNNHGSVYFGGDCMIRNNFFIHNYDYTPGVLKIIASSGKKPHIVNNVFAYNNDMAFFSNFYSSSIFLECDAVVANNTFFGNNTETNGNTVYASYCSPLIVNNIFWNNNREGFGWYNGAGGGIDNPIVKNNIIRGGYIRNGGSENMDVDPKFRMSDTLDFVLTNVSPGINKGLSDTTGLYLGNVDIIGNNRLDPFYSKIDIGAYEYTGTDVETSVLSIVPKSTKFEIFPNPAQSIIFIPEEFTNSQFQIINMNFVIVKSGFVQSDFIIIEDILDGFYVIRITHNNKYYSASFIKE